MSEATKRHYDARAIVDSLHAGQPGWLQCDGCRHWYTSLGLEKHKCPAASAIESPYDIKCLTVR